jgi:hypothetical protein
MPQADAKAAGSRPAVLTCGREAMHRAGMEQTRNMRARRALRAGSASLAIFLLAGTLASPLLARPLVPAERRYFPYSGALPACTDPGVLERVSSQFAGVEDEYWKSGLKILSYDVIREVSYRGDGLDLIPRRYCQAKGVFNDGRVRPVTYNIGEELGFASYGFGVELCVGGLDRENAYAPNCKMVRP